MSGLTVHQRYFPGGGVRVSESRLRAWQWNGGANDLSEPVRCRQNQWYLVRVRASRSCDDLPPGLGVRFLRATEPFPFRRIEMSPLGDESAAEMLGWVQSPNGATHVCLALQGDPAREAAYTSVELHPLDESEPGGHPCANVPRWSSYPLTTKVSRLVGPAPLARVAEWLPGVSFERVTPGRTTSLDASRLRDAAILIDRPLLRGLGLDFANLLRLAANSMVVVDLEAFAALMSRSRLRDIGLCSASDRHAVMGARNLYAAAATRGFALQDVFPYGETIGQKRFSLRGLRRCRSLKSLARELQLITLLESCTPTDPSDRAVLSAMIPAGPGALMISDVPWLAAKEDRELAAPRIMRHLLRMMFGEALAEGVQYWRASQDIGVLLRDIGDLPRRYPPLQAARWASESPGVARIGLTLAAPGIRNETGTTRARGSGNSPAPGAIVIDTGRIDAADWHDGLPAEPMIIFMRWLAREAREQTNWYRESVGDRRVTWLFETAQGRQYVSQFPSAGALNGGSDANGSPRLHRVRMRFGSGAPSTRDVHTLWLPRVKGLLGDDSLEWQAMLHHRVARLLASQSIPRASNAQ